MLSPCWSGSACHVGDSVAHGSRSYGLLQSDRVDDGDGEDGVRTTQQASLQLLTHICMCDTECYSDTNICTVYSLIFGRAKSSSKLAIRNIWVTTRSTMKH